jgi:predicted transcriptional regulator
MYFDRSKNWIMRQRLSEWIAEEQSRYELALEALKCVDEGRTIRYEHLMATFEKRKRARGSP